MYTERCSRMHLGRIPFERYIVIDGYRSDEITHRDDVTSWMNISSFNVEPTNSVVKTEWTNLYKGINYANQCLTNIPTVPGDSESLNALKKQSIAEARFCVLTFIIVCM